MTSRRLRFALLLATASAGSAAIVSCVGDSPIGGSDKSPDGSVSSGSSGTSGGASSSSGGSSSGGSSSGGSSSGSSGLDGGADAATACGAEIGCPAEISGSHLQLWLRGDRGVDCVESLTTAWNDQSGHGRNAVPVGLADGGSALPPVCGLALINAKPVISFDSAYDANGGYIEDKTLKVDLSFLQDSSFSVAVVHRRTQSRYQAGLLTFGKVYDGICVGNDPHTGLFELAANYANPTSGERLQYEVESSCNTGYYPGVLADTSAELLEYVYSATIGRHVYRNGIALQEQDATDAGVVGVTSDAGANARIGRAAISPAIPMDTRYGGEIAEIVGYDEALSASDRTALEAYLKNKWALP